MRTCLLCDKPLSRIWLGAGEDFCSREHRNQYRLRRGMDRLLEANKVANLMRRRENPKPLSPFREIGEGGIPRRGFFEAQSARPSEAPVLPGDWRRTLTAGRRLALDAGMSPINGWRPRRLYLAAAPREAPAPRLALAQAVLEMHSPRSRPGVHIMAADIARFSGSSRGALEPGTGQARSDTVRWHPSVHLHLDPRRVTRAVFRVFMEARGSRPAQDSSPRGYMLRVSPGAGFRIQAARLRGLRIEWPNPEVPRLQHEILLESPSRTGQADARSASGKQFPPTAPVFPGFEAEEPEARMEWPELLSPGGRTTALPGFSQPSGHLPHPGAELQARSHESQQPVLVAAAPPPIRHGGIDRAPALARPPRPSGRPPAPRAASVAIGCVADGVSSLPGAPPESRSMIEERFDSGWRNWTGGYGNWTVDAAGARTGSLALFTPSLDWRDYELEFFARIENHSLTWVYRAAGLNDYYLAALTALPGKGYAFTRRTVWRGKPGAAYTAPLSVLPNAKNAYLIRMQIVGTQFSLSIDGQLIETWTDSRLSAGGVGFIGAPEDRARIYWVRFYPGPAKESSRK